jgi:hypothetical protein
MWLLMVPTLPVVSQPLNGFAATGFAGFAAAAELNGFAGFAAAAEWICSHSRWR